MATSTSTLIPWRVDGPTTLHGFDDDLVYMLVCTDTDDPELQRQVALVSAWDVEGENYAPKIAAVPKLLAACQAVVDRWEHGDLAEAARMCAEALRTASSQPAAQDSHDRTLADLVAKAEAAGLKAEDFDETVHDLANSISADINNAGVPDQLRYLLQEWGHEAAAREIDRLAEEKGSPHHEETKHGKTTAPQP
jgi:hypothetical protein